MIARQACKNTYVLAEAGLASTHSSLMRVKPGMKAPLRPSSLRKEVFLPETKEETDAASSPVCPVSEVSEPVTKSVLPSLSSAASFLSVDSTASSFTRLSDEDIFEELSETAKPMQRTHSEFVVPSLKIGLPSSRPGVLTSSHASSVINSPLARFTFTDQEASIGMTPSAYQLRPAVDASVPKPKPFDRLALLGENSPSPMRVKSPLAGLQSPGTKMYSPAVKMESPDVRMGRTSRFATVREKSSLTAPL